MIQGNRGGKVDYSWEDPDDVMLRRALSEEVKRAANPAPIAGLVWDADGTPRQAPVSIPAQSTGGNAKVDIRVHNLTGGSAIISTSQIAH